MEQQHGEIAAKMEPVLLALLASRRRLAARVTLDGATEKSGPAGLNLNREKASVHA
jgi:hypothetical protein